MRYVFVFLMLFFFFKHSFSQVNRVSGVITDSRTGEPLAFVAVGIKEQQKGTTTDIDGKFSLYSETPFTHLQINYLGYESQIFPVPSAGEGVSVRLVRSSYALKEVVVMPGTNPAERIIRKAVTNKELNRPENLSSFSYESYNKFIYTIENPSGPGKSDFADPQAQEFLSRSNLFMMESVTERKYLKPDRSKETVLATKVSGLSEPSIALLATEFQSFSFYPEILKVNTRNYVNPLSKGTFSKYFFLLEDTVFEGRDTIYVISFKPLPGKNFDALQGVLHINTNGYALQNVIASPIEEEEQSGKNQIKMGIKIQQKYEFVQGKHWFPVQLNADLSIKSIIDPGKSVTILGVSRSYIKNIRINPAFSSRDFDHIALDYSKDAGRREESFWKPYRTDSLTEKEKTTYRVIDSLGKKYQFDKIEGLMKYLATGQIPYGILSVDIARVLVFNNYEGVRLGLGLHTNDRLLKWMSVGGYYAFGFKDNAAKYGYDLSLQLHERRELKLSLLYFNDVSESGGLSFYNNRKAIISNEGLREYLVKLMDRHIQEEASISFRALKYLNVKSGIRKFKKVPTDGYLFLGGDGAAGTFNFGETELAARFAFRERSIRTFNMLVPVASKYPVLWAQWKQGFKGLLEGEYSYTKLDARVEYSFFIKDVGTPTLQVAAGKIFGDLPNTENYVANASYGLEVLNIRIINSFQTMRMNEFVSDRYVSFFLSHNFGRLLMRYKRFQPTIEWSGNVGFGALSNAADHANRTFRTMEKGFFETGISLNNMYKMSFLGFGLGVFYRFGPYSFSNELDNMAFLLTYSPSF
jgi:hypothetical protein